MFNTWVLSQIKAKESSIFVSLYAPFTAPFHPCISVYYTLKMRPDAKLGRPDAPMWSLQMIIIIIWRGGNETHSHLERPRSPTRKPQVIFQNQYKRIKTCTKHNAYTPTQKNFLTIFVNLSIICQWRKSYDSRSLRHNY